MISYTRFSASVVALVIFIVCTGGTVSATIVEKQLEYSQEGTLLQGTLYFDDALSGERPGVLVVHQWKGIGSNEQLVGRRLAELGYVAFLADIYGKGVRPSTNEDATKVSDTYKSDRLLFRKRVIAGLEALKRQPHVHPGKIAAIGYCFGGTGVLELARSGQSLAGVVSFHGGLDAPQPATEPLKTKVLVLHGIEDPFVPREQLFTFVDEMRAVDADFQIITYPQAVHAFTSVSAGNDPTKGVAYNKQADMRSWEAMKIFFKELF